MRETAAIIERVWRVSPAYQRLELTVEPALAQIQPGQSVLALIGESNWEPYLREQWLPVEHHGSQLIVERPAQQSYKPGQTVNLIGPVGSPFPWSGGRHLLLIAQDTAPTPLLLLAQHALAQTAEVALVLLGEEAINYPYNALPPAVEVISGNVDNTWVNQDTILEWADQIFVVVHEGFWLDYFSNLFHKVKQVRSKIPLNFLYGVFNLPLPCGTGACMACMVRCKTSNKLICTQGPALDLVEVLLS